MFEYNETPTRNNTKKKIVEASKTLFEEHGISSTQIKQIADLAGLTRATIYDHFPNKDYIIYQVLYEYFLELYSFSLEITEDMDGFHKIKLILHKIFSQYFEKDHIMRFLISYYQTFPKRTSTEQEIFSEIEKVVHIDRILDYITEGIDDGSITCSNHRKVTNIILQHIVGLPMRYSLREDAFFGATDRPNINELHKSIDLIVELYRL